MMKRLIRQHLRTISCVLDVDLLTNHGSHMGNLNTIVIIYLVCWNTNLISNEVSTASHLTRRKSRAIFPEVRGCTPKVKFCSPANYISSRADPKITTWEVHNLTYMMWSLSRRTDCISNSSSLILLQNRALVLRHTRCNQFASYQIPPKITWRNAARSLSSEEGRGPDETCLSCRGWDKVVTPHRASYSCTIMTVWLSTLSSWSFHEVAFLVKDPRW